MGKYRPSYAELEERLRHTLGRLRAVRESLTEATEQRDALQAEVESLRLQAEMACIDPRPDCGCSGCQYANEVNGRG